jgi:hypothetical protein
MPDPGPVVSLCAGAEGAGVKTRPKDQLFFSLKLRNELVFYEIPSRGRLQ